MRWGSSRSTALQVLAASVLLHHHHIALSAAVGAGHEAHDTPSTSTAVQHASPLGPASPSASSSSQAVLSAGGAFGLVAASGVLLEKIGVFLTSIVPDSMEGVEFEDETSFENDPLQIGGGGLFGDEDGSTLAWGGSTLEVVKTQASYLTRPAAFGPRIVDDEGLRGTLLPISDFYQPKHADDVDISTVSEQLTIDNFGCPYRGGPGWRDDDDDDNGRSKLPGEDFVPTANTPPRDWIALIERGGNCSFIDKVRVAQALKAKAVVVGDAPSPHHQGHGPDAGLSGQLVTMFAPGDTHDIRIPSTFVTRPSYVDLIRLVDEETQDGQQECAQRKKKGKTCESNRRGVEVILWRDDVMWEWPLIDLAFVLLMLPSFMTLVTIVIHRVRMIHRRRKERAPEVVVLNLPCLIWRGNGQPWEKVEDASMVGADGAHAGEGVIIRNSNGLDDQQPQSFNRFVVYQTRVRSWLGRRLQRRSVDMESGGDDDVEDANSSAVPLATTNVEDEAGPSTLPLKTTPVAPPKPPSDRTYYSCDECAICLSDFVDGDLVRVLPCGHVFHLAEIDSWLTRVKRLCPICKRDITIPPAPPIPSAVTVAPTSGTGSTNEQTPLLVDHDV